jgi:nicotinamidase-related amidase
MKPALFALATIGALAGACRGADPSPPTAAPTTLRALYGVDRPRAIVASKTALVLVDYQEEFFRGPLPVVGAREAVGRASTLLAWARTNGLLVVHARNVAARPNSLLFDAASPNVEIVPALAPSPGELVLTKSMAGAFSRTDLDRTLRDRGVDTLVVGGIMTHLAVDTTARDAMVLGFRVVVAGDACATRALPSATGGAPVEAADVHRAALASLADRFADVLSTHEVVALPIVR